MPSLPPVTFAWGHPFRRACVAPSALGGTPAGAGTGRGCLASRGPGAEPAPRPNPPGTLRPAGTGGFPAAAGAAAFLSVPRDPQTRRRPSQRITGAGESAEPGYRRRRIAGSAEHAPRALGSPPLSPLGHPSPTWAPLPPIPRPRPCPSLAAPSAPGAESGPRNIMSQFQINNIFF